MVENFKCFYITLHGNVLFHIIVNVGGMDTYNQFINFSEEAIEACFASPVVFTIHRRILIQILNNPFEMFSV